MCNAFHAATHRQTPTQPFPSSGTTHCLRRLGFIEAILLLHLLNQSNILLLRLLGSDAIIDDLLPGSLLRFAFEIESSWVIGLLDRWVLERLLVVCVEFLRLFSALFIWGGSYARAGRRCLVWRSVAWIA